MADFHHLWSGGEEILNPVQSSPVYILIGPDLLTACASTNRLLALKLYCQVLLKMRSEELTLKRRGYSYLCT